MNTLKTIATIIGYASLLFYSLITFFLWGTMYGGVGFFGAMITFPFSVMAMFVILIFSSIQAFINNIFWVGVSIALIVFGSSE